ncbi:zinc finger protein 43-like [Patiria miniata]|uniref:C2H2-type domain-containing protein n=1 Tax=Patiria miniata TaxID=46514 RepID=A0A913Z9H0_PATMI|nr:zinc finger protein 43-like [Patiria miniata]
MDTFVVLPKELLLSVGQYSPVSGDKVRSENDRTEQPPWRAWGLSVWSAVPLHAGTRFTTNQGVTVLVRLGCAVGNRQYPQVWSNFGCYEEIHQGSKHYERHCNWVCFLQSVESRDRANIVVYKVKGKPIFEVIKFVPACSQLMAFFQVTDHSICSILGPDINPPHEKMLTQSTTSTNHEAERKILWSTIAYQARRGADEYLASNMSLSSAGLCHPSGVRIAEVRKDLPLWTSPRRGKERTSLPCEVCGKSFDRPSLLRRHMRTHTGEKPHSCTVCGKAFSTSSSLNTHCRIHSGEKPHVCSVCGKRFTASSNLYYHRMTHRKDKPHKCTLCCKSFPTPGDLRSHMFVHNGSWPFKCQFCNRGFSKHTNLKNHIMLHTGEKPHVCVLCGKRFALICNLKSHSKTHQARQHTAQCLSNKTTSAFNGPR